MDKKIDTIGRKDVHVPSVSDVMGKKNPEHKFRAGAISATIWENPGEDSEGKPTVFKTISLARSYKDKEGNWQNTSGLRVSDLPKAILVLSKAYEHLTLKDIETEE